MIKENNGIEIERRWLVKSVDSVIELNKFPRFFIEQWYISINPIIRIRSTNRLKFELCIKTKGTFEGIGVNESENILNVEEFENLIHSFIKKNNSPISKTRFLIPLDNKLLAEIDVFEGDLTGLIIIEVEFKSEKEAENFNPPEWFGNNEITGKKEYSNANLYQSINR